MSASENLSPGKPAFRRVTLATAAVLASLITLAITLHIRQWHQLDPHFPGDPARIRFEPYIVGIGVAQLVIPVALIYLFSSTYLFKRVVSDEAAPRDRRGLFGVLAMIQFVFLSYDWLVFEADRAPLGFLVVVAGGLLGGWRVGLGLGLITFLVRPTQMFVSHNRGFFEVWRIDGWQAVYHRLPHEMFAWYYLENLAGLLAVWAGIVAGICADLLGERRFSPGAALGIAVGIDLWAGFLMVMMWANWAVFLISGTLVSGLAMAAIALIVRNVQAEATRRKAKAAELARTQAELRVLRAQINPHFLFNALNTIRYFVRTDPEAARCLLLHLSEVFQRALRSGEFVALRDELSYVEAYLALEKARLDKRLQVEWSVQAETWLDHPVPTLILQPIVENAVIHGIARKAEGGIVRITVEQVNDDLVLRVEDDGPGVAPARLAEIHNPAEASGAAIGLRNVDGRLRTLYGEDYRLTIQSEVGRGTRVQIRIPLVS